MSFVALHSLRLAILEGSKEGREGMKRSEVSDLRREGRDEEV